MVSSKKRTNREIHFYANAITYPNRSTPSQSKRINSRTAWIVKKYCAKNEINKDDLDVVFMPYLRKKRFLFTCFRAVILNLRK